MGMGLGGGKRHLRQAGSEGKPTNPWVTFQRVIPWLKPYWYVILIGTLCLFATTYLGYQPQRIIGFLIDNAILGDEKKSAPFIVPYLISHGFVGKGHSAIPGLVGLVLGIFLVSKLLGFLRTYWLHIAGQRLLHSLRVRLYEHYQRLSLTFYDNRQTGDLMSRMSSDVEQIEHLMVHGFDIVITGLFGMLITFWYMHNMHAGLTWFVLIPVPLIVIGIYFFSKAVRIIYKGIRERIGDLNARLQDNLSGIRVIKAFSREATELDHVTQASGQVLRMNIRGIRMWSSFGPFMQILGEVGTLTVLGVGAVLVTRGALSVGDLIIFLSFVGSFYHPIGQLFQFNDSIMRALAAADRIFEILDTKLDICDPEQPTNLPPLRGEVALDHVSFRYATGEMVLKDVSVQAAPGQRIALVGRSGAGKSSFINLIPRFYDVLEGQVLVDGIDVRAMRQTDLRRHIALVLQDTFLFNGTVRENLRYGKLDAADIDLLAASQAANAHEFIERLPNGYDTEIGERGVKLSGGQKQRLAIARAVLADPRILILDEATSSVDSESEFLIHQALDRLMEGRTTFIIAHRLSTIKHADLILVLENGEVIERGNHRELLKADGHYARMYRQQFWLDELFRDEEEGDEKDEEESEGVEMELEGEELASE